MSEDRSTVSWPRLLRATWIPAAGWGAIVLAIAVSDIMAIRALGRARPRGMGLQSRRKLDDPDATLPLHSRLQHALHPSHSTIGVAIELAAMVFGTCQWLLYIVQTYHEGWSDTSIVFTAIFCSFFSARYLLHLLMVEPGRRVQWAMHFDRVCDVWATLSALAPLLDYVGTFWTWGFLRIVNVYFAMRNLEPFLEPTLMFTKVQRFILRLILLIACYLSCMGCIVATVEQAGDPDNWGSVVFPLAGYSAFNGLYFALITSTTVGYGDITPKTLLGRIFTMLFVVGGIILISFMTSRLLDLLAGQRYGQGTFSNPSRRAVILIIGEIDAEALVNVLHELFHPEHEGARQGLHAVVMAESDTYSQEANRYLSSHPLFSTTVTYIHGSVFDASDMKRSGSGTPECQAVLVMQRALAGKDQDTANLLRVLAVRRHLPHLPIYVQLACAENTAFLRAAGVPDDSVLPMDALRNGLAAANVVTPGVATLLINLFSTDIVLASSTTHGIHGGHGRTGAGKGSGAPRHNTPQQNAPIRAGPAQGKPVTPQSSPTRSVLQQQYSASSLLPAIPYVPSQDADTGAGARNFARQLLKALEADADRDQSIAGLPPTAPFNAPSRSKSGAGSSAPDWEDEYGAGLGQEVYEVRCPTWLVGRSLHDAVLIVYCSRLIKEAAQDVPVTVTGPTDDTGHTGGGGTTRGQSQGIRSSRSWLPSWFTRGTGQADSRRTRLLPPDHLGSPQDDSMTGTNPLMEAMVERLNTTNAEGPVLLGVRHVKKRTGAVLMRVDLLSGHVLKAGDSLYIIAKDLSVLGRDIIAAGRRLIEAQPTALEAVLLPRRRSADVSPHEQTSHDIDAKAFEENLSVLGAEGTEPSGLRRRRVTWTQDSGQPLGQTPAINIGRGNASATGDLLPTAIVPQEQVQEVGQPSTTEGGQVHPLPTEDSHAVGGAAPTPLVALPMASTPASAPVTPPLCPLALPTTNSPHNDPSPSPQSEACSVCAVQAEPYDPPSDLTNHVVVVAAPGVEGLAALHLFLRPLRFVSDLPVVVISTVDTDQWAEALKEIREHMCFDSGNGRVKRPHAASDTSLLSASTPAPAGTSEYGQPSRIRTRHDSRVRIGLGRPPHIQAPLYYVHGSPMQGAVLVRARLVYARRCVIFSAGQTADSYRGEGYVSSRMRGMSSSTLRGTAPGRESSNPADEASVDAVSVLSTLLIENSLGNAAPALLYGTCTEVTRDGSVGLLGPAWELTAPQWGVDTAAPTERTRPRHRDTRGTRVPQGGRDNGETPVQPWVTAEVRPHVSAVSVAQPALRLERGASLRQPPRPRHPQLLRTGTLSPSPTMIASPLASSVMNEGGVSAAVGLLHFGPVTSIDSSSDSEGSVITPKASSASAGVDESEARRVERLLRGETPSHAQSFMVRRVRVCASAGPPTVPEHKSRRVTQTQPSASGIPRDPPTQGSAAAPGTGTSTGPRVPWWAPWRRKGNTHVPESEGERVSGTGTGRGERLTRERHAKQASVQSDWAEAADRIGFAGERQAFVAGVGVADLASGMGVGFKWSPRFAAGRLLPVSCVYSLLVQSFYNPSLLRLIRLFAAGDAVRIRHLPVPPRLLHGKACTHHQPKEGHDRAATPFPLHPAQTRGRPDTTAAPQTDGAVQRPRVHTRRSVSSVGTTATASTGDEESALPLCDCHVSYGRLFLHLVLHERAVPLGLLRDRSWAAAPLPYVHTNPSMDAPVRAGDVVFVVVPVQSEPSRESMNTRA